MAPRILGQIFTFATSARNRGNKKNNAVIVPRSRQWSGDFPSDLPLVRFYDYYHGWSDVKNGLNSVHRRLMGTGIEIQTEDPVFTELLEKWCEIINFKSKLKEYSLDMLITGNGFFELQFAPDGLLGNIDAGQNIVPGSNATARVEKSGSTILTDLGTFSGAKVIDFQIYDDRSLVGNVDGDTQITFVNIPFLLLLSLRLYIRSTDPIITIAEQVISGVDSSPPITTAVGDFLDNSLASDDQSTIQILSVKKTMKLEQMLLQILLLLLVQLQNQHLN